MISECPACSEAGGRVAFTIRSHRFRRCRRCASLWLESRPSQLELADLYAGSRYFENPEFGPCDYHGYKDYRADRDHIIEKFGEVLARIETQLDPGRLLDLGCGPGLMLRAAEEREWSAQGLDLNGWAVDQALAQGLDARRGSLPDPALERGSFEAVTMMDLLEHVPDPAALVEEARRLLRPGGVIAILTPDAGSATSRALGRRWPEALRAPEHVTLFSARGLAALLRRSGFVPLGRHSVGKTSSLATLASDVAPISPGLLEPIAGRIEGSRIGRLTFDLDPRTKLCMYARSEDPEEVAALSRRRVPRLPRRPPPQAPVEAVLDDLRALGSARGLRDWLFERLLGGGPPARCAEVGAGIGTFTSLLLEGGAEHVLALEPDEVCRGELLRELGDDPRLEIVADAVPGSAALAAEAGEFDLVLCQNVLEHVSDHRGALAEMAAALRPGGTLALLVPAGPRLYGSLDLSYGHRRRYDSAQLADLLTEAGLDVDQLGYVNLLGVPGWWLSNRRGRSGIGRGAVRAYEALLRLWRPLEDRLRPGAGLSLVARARRPAG